MGVLADRKHVGKFRGLVCRYSMVCLVSQAPEPNH